MPWDNYRYKKPETCEPGDYRCVIMSAEVKQSRSGNNMIEITLRPSGTTIGVKTWLVDNEYFDANASRFLDAFPVLKVNFNPDESWSWRGAMGAAKFKKDANGFLAVERFISAENAEYLPEFVWKAKDGEPQIMPEYVPAQGTAELYGEGEFPFG